MLIRNERFDFFCGFNPINDYLFCLSGSECSMKHLVLILGLISFGANAQSESMAAFKAVTKVNVSLIQRVCLIDGSNYRSYEECYAIYSDFVKKEFSEELKKELEK